MRVGVDVAAVVWVEVDRGKGTEPSLSMIMPGKSIADGDGGAVGVVVPVVGSADVEADAAAADRAAARSALAFALTNRLSDFSEYARWSKTPSNRN